MHSNGEFLVNSQTANYQFDASISSLANGGFVVTWADLSGTLGDTSSTSIKAKIFNSAGALVTDEFLVNSQTNSSQFAPSITSLANGGFVVTWVDLSGTLGDADDRSIKAKIFDAGGSLVTDEFLVNSQTYSYQNFQSITALANGNFVVTWQDDSGTLEDASGTSIKAKIFNAAGALMNDEFLVNSQTNNDQEVPSITSLANGGFVVTWLDRSGTLEDFDGPSINAKIFDATGTLVTDEFLVNSQTNSYQANPSITSLVNGGFVVTWQDYSGTLGDASDGSIKAKIFDASGTLVTDEFLVNSQTNSYQAYPSITSLVNGGFVVSWHDDSGTLGDTSDTSIKAKIFNETGALVIDEFLVNSQTNGYQDSPSITSLLTGGFVVTWQDNSGTLGDADGSSIRAKIFDANGNVVIPGEQEEIAPKSTADLIEEFGELGLMAMLSKAAYQLRDDEPTDIAHNEFDAKGEGEYRNLKDDLLFLGPDQLIGLESSTDGLWKNGIGVGQDNQGIFTNDNAGALVARSIDSLFIAFRGINNDGLSGYDQVDLVTRTDHFNKFAELLEEVTAYVSSQNATGQEINKIYLTGHSLGAAMVLPAIDWLKGQASLAGIEFEAVTFANPGYGVGFNTSAPEITNFWNAIDLIRLPELPSQSAGSEFVFNNVVNNLFDGVTPLSAHSMDYYLSISKFLITEGRAINASSSIDLGGLDIEDLRSGFGLEIDRISFGTVLVDGNYAIGKGKDVILAGVIETYIDVTSAVVTEVITSWSTITSVLTSSLKFMNATGSILDGDSSQGTKDLLSLSASFLKENGGKLFKFMVKLGLFLGETAIKVVEDLNASDLVLGGAGDDVLNGMGGHDVIFGGAGNDFLYADAPADETRFSHGGRDTLYGGAGNDILHAGDHGDADNLYGGIGNDLYWVWKASDRVHEAQADVGKDAVISNVSYSLDRSNSLGVENISLLATEEKTMDLTGNGIANAMIGNNAKNTIKGLGGNDRISGQGGKDKLFGGADNDMLWGGAKSDNLDGGIGDDTLDGGLDADVLVGGQGSDVFVFSTSEESDGDFIQDFVAGVDKIDLTGLASEVAAAGFLHFTGTTNDHSVGGVFFKQFRPLIGANYTEIRVNLDGGWRSEVVITLSQLRTPDAMDFIF